MRSGSWSKWGSQRTTGGLWSDGHRGRCEPLVRFRGAARWRLASRPASKRCAEVRSQHDLSAHFGPGLGWLEPPRGPTRHPATSCGPAPRLVGQPETERKADPSRIYRHRRGPTGPSGPTGAAAAGGYQLITIQYGLSPWRDANRVYVDDLRGRVWRGGAGRGVANPWSKRPANSALAKRRRGTSNALNGVANSVAKPVGSSGVTSGQVASTISGR